MSACFVYGQNGVEHTQSAFDLNTSPHVSFSCSAGLEATILDWYSHCGVYLSKHIHASRVWGCTLHEIRCSEIIYEVIFGPKYSFLDKNTDTIFVCPSIFCIGMTGKSLVVMNGPQSSAQLRNKLTEAFQVSREFQVNRGQTGRTSRSQLAAFRLLRISIWISDHSFVPEITNRAFRWTKANCNCCCGYTY